MFPRRVIVCDVITRDCVALVETHHKINGLGRICVFDRTVVFVLGMWILAHYRGLIGFVSLAPKSPRVA